MTPEPRLFTNQKYLSGRRVKTAVTALSFAGGGATALVGTISAYVGYRAVRPRRRTLPHDQSGSPLPMERITFQSTDGLKLNGHFYPSGNTLGSTVIICHGFHGAAADTHDPALTFQEAGYNVLTFDFRGCGASEGRTTSVGYYEVRDLLGAIKYVKERPEVNPDKIGVYGFSMGGAIAIMTAASSPDIKVLLTDSAFANLDNVLDYSFKHFYRLPTFPFKHPVVLASKVFSRTFNKKFHPYEALKELSETGRSIPIMIIHGESDGAVPVTEAHLLHEQHEGPKELWIVPDSRHVVAKHVDREEYVGRVVGFFDRYLKPQPPNLV